MNHYITLEEAKLTKKHYENFPVATFLFPKKNRNAATILYLFARTADDIADEGSMKKNQRLILLNNYQENIDKIKNNNSDIPDLFKDIDKIIRNYSIPIKLFESFLIAFKQDVIKNKYKNFNELIGYCNNAASPAGQMILGLFQSNSKENITYSNYICQALALIGMTQDFHEDHLKGRLYIPADEMKKFNLKESDIKNLQFTSDWELFKKFWLSRIELLLNKGAPLETKTHGRLRLQVRIMIAAARLLLKRMEDDRCNLFLSPAKLTKIDWVILLCRCILIR